MRRVAVKTTDGTCPAFVFTPEGDGPWPAALMYMDAPGMRPALQDLAARLASAGYYVLLPDLYYRSGPYEPIHAATVFGDRAARETHRMRFQTLVTPAKVMADTEAFLDAIDADDQALPGPYGVVGYCMGGRLALIAAGTFPDRFAVAASYHGGGLANDTLTSPHLLAPRMRAKVYVAGATEDANFDEAQKVRLEHALSAAGVDHLIETYPARHGWVPSDTAAHDAVQAEHHWRTLIPLFDGVIKP